MTQIYNKFLSCSDIGECRVLVQGESVSVVMEPRPWSWESGGREGKELCNIHKKLCICRKKRKPYEISHLQVLQRDHCFMVQKS